MGQISVQQSVLAEGQAIVNRGTGLMEGELERLNTFIRGNLQVVWKGGAMDEYTVRQARWDRAMESLRDNLTKYVVSLGKSAEGYAAAEAANRASMAS